MKKSISLKKTIYWYISTFWINISDVTLYVHVYILIISKISLMRIFFEKHSWNVGPTHLCEGIPACTRPNLVVYHQKWASFKCFCPKMTLNFTDIAYRYWYYWYYWYFHFTDISVNFQVDFLCKYQLFVYWYYWYYLFQLILLILIFTT